MTINSPRRIAFLIALAAVSALLVVQALTPANRTRVQERAGQSAGTPSTTAPVPPETIVDSSTGQSWRLLSSKADDFDGSALQDMWSTYHGPGNEGVGLRRASAISVKDGELRITGSGNVSGGMSQSFGQTYGRWDIRARMDKGTGYGPAILLWPDSERWPKDGELDIVEIPTGDRSAAFSASHYGADNRMVNHTVPGDFSQWHTYSVEWLPDRVTFLIDDVPTFVVTDKAAIPHKPMHLAIQNDVGAAGHNIAPRNRATPGEVALHVDWVKVFEPAS